MHQQYADQLRLASTICNSGQSRAHFSQKNLISGVKIFFMKHTAAIKIKSVFNLYKYPSRCCRKIYP